MKKSTETTTKEIKASLKEIDEGIGSLREVTRKAAELTNNLKKLEGKISSLGKENKDLYKEIFRLWTVGDFLKRDLKSLKEQPEKSYDNQFVWLQKEVSNMSTNVNTNFENFHNELQACLHRIICLENNLQDEKTRNQNLQKQLQNLEQKSSLVLFYRGDYHPVTFFPVYFLLVITGLVVILKTWSYWVRTLFSQVIKFIMKKRHWYSLETISSSSPTGINLNKPD